MGQTGTGYLHFALLPKKPRCTVSKGMCGELKHHYGRLVCNLTKLLAAEKSVPSYPRTLSMGYPGRRRLLCVSAGPELT